MALKVGELYVALTANVQQFHKKMAEVADQIARIARKLKYFGNDIAELGLPVAAAMAGVVAIAAETNDKMAAELQRLKGTIMDAASEIGMAFLPAVQQLNALVENVTAAFRRLSPEQKQLIADWGVLIAQLAVGALAFSKVMAAVSVLAEAIAMLIPLVAGVFSAPVIAGVVGIGVALAGTILLVGALRQAWDENLGGIRDITKAAAFIIRTEFERAATFAMEAASFLVRAWADQFQSLRRLVLGFVLSFGEAWLSILELVPSDAAKQLVARIRGVKADIANAIDQPFQFLTDTASLDGMLADLKTMADEAGKSIAIAWERGLETTGIQGVLDNIKAKIAEFRDLFGGATGTNFGAPIEGLKKAAKAAVDFSDLIFGRKSPVLEAAERAAAESLRKQAEAFAQAVKDARGFFVGRLKSAFAGVTDLVESFQHGAVLGGAAGGIAGIAAALLMRSEEFQTVAKMVESVLQSFANVLGRVLVGLEPVIGGLATMTEAIGGALAPILEAVAPILAGLAPVFVLIGTLFAALAPILSMVAKVLEPVIGILSLAFRGLFEGLKVVATIVLTIAKAIGDVWNGILGAIQAVFRALGSIDLFGWKPLEFLNDWADGIERAKAPTDEMARALVELQGLTWEQAQAVAAETAGRVKNIDAMREATEALTNVPQGYRVALARFNAMDPVTGAPTAAHPATNPAAAPVQQHNGDNITNINVTKVLTEDEFTALQERVRRAQAAPFGRSSRGAPRYVRDF